MALHRRGLPQPWQAFQQITTLLSTIQDHTILAGIWYIVDNTKLCTEIDTLALERVRKLCRKRLLLYIMIVTTHWDASLSLQELEHLYKQKQETYRELLQHGAVMYKLGRVYENGVETPGVIQWNKQGRTKLIRQLKDMITQRFHRFPATEPLIFDGLKNRM
jgi:hypothetical protein